MNFYLYAAIPILLAISILFTVLYIKNSNKLKALSDRFKSVIDVDNEKARIQKEVEGLLSKENELKESYKSKRLLYDDLLKEIGILEEDVELFSFGIYKPHFDFGTSDEYKDKITEIKNKQKEVVRDKNAATCRMEWEVSGSKVEGRKMTNRNIKLVVRAFNGECDSAILKAKWNNVDKMEARINKAYEALNKLSEPNHVEITPQYLQLKLDELYLAHEYQDKLYEEKEEQRQIQEQMREEEKVKREIETATKQAEQDEQRYQKALEQAKTEVGAAHGEKLSKLQEKMRLLEKKLREAQENRERALSRAQMTKSGHVYVISNIGSFGSKVFKIGMTRRLEPLDRVKELGDASVPFRFDVHAMIYSDNAPELENKLHKVFNVRRMNLVNQRKEFFYATLDEIERIVKQNNGKIEFTKVAEAKEYRETFAIREKTKIEKQKQAEVEKKFPATI